MSAARPKTSSAGIVDARSVRGASTVTATGLAGKQVSGREVFGLVDTLGSFVGVRVLVGSASCRLMPG